MGIKYIARWTVRVVIAGGALLSVASAQNLPPGNDGPELDGTDEVQLTPAQMQTAVPEIVAKVSTDERRVTDMLSEAQEAKDVPKVLCLDPLAGEVALAKPAAKDRATEVTGALNTGNLTKARFSFNLLSVLAERVTIVMGQANSCVGQETGFVGDSAISVVVDPSLPSPALDSLFDFPVAVLDEPNVESAVE